EAIREPTALSPQLRNQIGAIIQAVRTSAAKRELEIEGSPGSETTFDPVKHAQDDPRITPASRVRLITPTVFQGRGANRRVFSTAAVDPPCTNNQNHHEQRTHDHLWKIPSSKPGGPAGPVTACTCARRSRGADDSGLWA